MAKKQGVATQHPEYLEALPTWKICRDVFKGTKELREHTIEYLPKLSGEPPAAYQARLNRTILYNSMYRTVSGFIGMLFRVPAVLDAPATTEAMTEDVTLTGIPLNVFAQELSEECLVVGRVGVLVNYPVTSESMTIADAAAQNIRPSLALVKAEQITNWRCKRINNKYQLSMVTVKEEHEVPITEFESQEQTIYRVMDIEEYLTEDGVLRNRYRVRMIQQQESQGAVTDVELERYYPTMNNAYMEFIPFYIVGPDNLDPAIDTPMLVDLADLCVAHYQAYADLANGTHWSGIPTMAVIGYEAKPEETLQVGAGKALVLPNPASKVMMVEVGTAGFSALENQLNRLESQMVTMGSRMLESHRVQAESAQTAGIYRAGENSILSAMSISISTGLTVALKVFAEWAGDNPSTVKFNLNKEFFKEPVSSDMLNALVAGWQAGGVSAKAKFQYLQRAEFYPPDMTFEEEQKAIEEHAPKAPPPKVTAIKKMPDGSMQASQA